MIDSQEEEDSSNSNDMETPTIHQQQTERDKEREKINIPVSSTLMCFNEDHLELSSSNNGGTDAADLEVYIMTSFLLL